MKNMTSRTLGAAALGLLLISGSASSVTGQTWLPGDVFVGVAGGMYNVYSFNSSGVLVLKQTISDGRGGFTTGCAFNSAGVAPALTRLYTTNFSNTKVVVYDNATPHSILQTVDTGATNPTGFSESIVFDAAANFYVGNPGSPDTPLDTVNHRILKYNSAGTLLTTFSAAVENRGTDWIDLAVDQKTLFYTSEGRRIKRFDTSAGTAGAQLSDFATFSSNPDNSTFLPGIFRALRLLPPGDGSGGLLVANIVDIKRLDGSGNVARTYSVAVTPTGITTSGSTTISSVSSLTGITVGMAISGTGIASNTTVTGISSPSTITISQAATATGTGVLLTISESSWHALSLDPNGTSFWAGNFASANFYRFNIFTGAVEVGPINTGTGANTLFGLCLNTPTISTVASVASGLNSPSAVAVDQGTGDVYIADKGLHQILKVSSGTTTPIAIAGNGTAGFSGDGGPATLAQLNTPLGLAVTGSSNTSNLIIYISDFGNQVIRKVSCSATPCTITTYAGTPGMFGSSGDGGLATSALLYNPKGLAVDASQNLYIADSFNGLIRKVSPTTGFITTVAGDGALTIVASLCGFITTSSGMVVSTCLGDGGSPTNATLNGPVDVKVDSAGNLYIADQGNNRIRKVFITVGPPAICPPSGPCITTVAGNGLVGSAGDGGPATSARLKGPSGVAVDSTGNLFIADGGNSRLRRVDAVTQNIGTVGGTGEAGFSLDNIPARFARLFQPTAVVVDGSGNPLLVDLGKSGDSRIRRVIFGP